MFLELYIIIFMFVFGLICMWIVLNWCILQFQVILGTKYKKYQKEGKKRQKGDFHEEE